MRTDLVRARRFAAVEIANTLVPATFAFSDTLDQTVAFQAA